MLTLVDFFCGAGGSSQGAHAVPGVEVKLAANHWAQAIESHARNFPDTDHYCGDIRDADMTKLPHGDLLWASPECPQWSQARGKQRDYDKQPDLFGDILPDEAAERSRALMWDVPRYLDAMARRGRPVLAGVVENVVDVRAWSLWSEWLASIRNLGYRTRLVAINSMHARPRVTPVAPQSRDRLYLVYWSDRLGRDPDWDKWLRPDAWCPTCGRRVRAVQTWKQPGRDMGRYRTQYVYRCPRVGCRNQILEPGVLPAAAAIDWTLPGTRIGDRPEPLKPKTRARIEAGLRRYARPITLEAAGNTFERRPGVRAWPVDWPLTTQTATATKAVAYEPLVVPTGGTWRDDATPVVEPTPARATRENDGVAMPPFLVPLRSGRDRSLRADTEPTATVAAAGSNHGLAVPPLAVPVEGRDRKDAQPADQPLRTQTGRNETGLAWAPFITELRGGSCDARPVTDPLGTVTASGNHHGLATPAGMGMVMRNNGSRSDGGEHSTPLHWPMRTLTTTGHQSLVTWRHLLVPYYGNSQPRPVTEPIGTLPTVDKYGLAELAVDVDDVLFRMLEPHEIGAAMAFADSYTVLGNKRAKVRQYGNAVTPPVAEVLVAALVEAITGEEIPA